MLEAIFAENDDRAAVNRDAFDTNGIRALNLMSSPGSGKTTVLAATLDALAGEFAVGIVEGDIATDLDAAKLHGRGAQISLLNTSNGFGGECHLDAPMVNRALAGLDLPALDLVVIENVGNLVCPSGFDLGEDTRLALLSVTEGEDKPVKYPQLFHSSDALVITKTDLADAVGWDRDAAYAALAAVNPDAPVIETSARTGAGVDAVLDLLLLTPSPEATAAGSIPSREAP